jgi:hypothetical protein
MSQDQWWTQQREREAAFDRVVTPVREEMAARLQSQLRLARVWSGHFGATGIDPKHLFVYFVLPRRDDVSNLKASTSWPLIESEMQAGLASAGFPVGDLRSSWLGCFSQQECDEEAAGNWYHFFK